MRRGGGNQERETERERERGREVWREEEVKECANAKQMHCLSRWQEIVVDFYALEHET